LASSSTPAAPTHAPPAPIAPVVNVAEQRRRQDEAARADPAAYAVNAVRRLQAVEAGTSLGGLASDLSHHFGLVPQEVPLLLAPIAVNPPPAPTLSTPAPGWVDLPSTSGATKPAEAEVEEDLFDLYLNADACSSPKTPELVVAGNGLHESPKEDEAEPLATPKQTTIDVGSGRMGGPTKRRRDESPRPDVPDLGSGFSWDDLSLATAGEWTGFSY
jgi:hypothetical protein